MFNIFFLRIVILLLACGYAAYTDYRTGYIYNWTNYSLILLALILNTFTYSLTYNLEVLSIALVIYLIGYVIYYYGKIGGGDIKLFIGIHLMLPYLFNNLFILYVLISSSLLCVVFVSTKYLFLLSKKVKFTKKLLLSRKVKIIRSFLLFIFFVFFLIYSINTTTLSPLLYFTLIPIFLGLVMVVFEEEIRKHIYLVIKPISQLEDGDVLAKDELSIKNFKELKLGSREVLEEEDIKRFKNMKLKSLPIYYNLPRFGPYIFLGVVVSLFILSIM